MKIHPLTSEFGCTVISRVISRLFTILLLLIAAGCSQTVKPTSPTDTPKDHYEAGIKLLNEKDLAKPEAEFQRAILLNKKSPYGHAGMAELEFKRQNWKKAVKHAENALKQDPKFSDSAILEAQALLTWKRSGWYERIGETLNAVLAYAPEDERALYYLGEAALHAHRLTEANDYFKKTADLEGKLAPQAGERIHLVARIKEQNPATEQSKEIARTVSITREEFCVLLITEMHLKDLLKNHRLTYYEAVYGDVGKKSKLPRDIELNENQRIIEDVLVLHLPSLDVLPNGFFYPDRPVNRSQAAMIIQDILTLIYDDTTLSARFNESSSRFPDVRPDYYAFNAIMIVTEGGIMTPNPKTNRFETDGAVSGIDALEIIRTLEKYISGG
jgi:Tfp pilus assembly protein PilF